MTAPVDGNEPRQVGDGLFGWAGEAFQWIRDLIGSSEYEPYQRSADVSSAAVSELTADIRLLAVIATGVMILAALALLIGLIAVLRTQTNQPLWLAHAGGHWLAHGVQVYPSSGPVAQVGYAPGYPGMHPDDQPLVPAS